MSILNILTVGNIVTTKNGVYTKLGNSNMVNLAQDTVYSHPSEKQCNYSVDTSVFIKRSDLDSYIPKIEANVKRDAQGNVRLTKASSTGTNLSFSGQATQQATVRFELTNDIPIYFASASMTYGSIEKNGDTGVTTTLYMNDVKQSTDYLFNNYTSLYLGGVINPIFTVVYEYTSNSLYKWIKLNDVVLNIFYNIF